MGKYNDLLIEFMTEKNRIVKKSTRLLITIKPDMDELRSWPEDKCEGVLKLFSTISDSTLCPWCMVGEKQRKCLHCTYGERNGLCNDPDSRYLKILTRRTSRLVNDNDIIDLYKNTKHKLNKL